MSTYLVAFIVANLSNVSQSVNGTEVGCSIPKLTVKTTSVKKKNSEKLANVGLRTSKGFIGLLLYDTILIKKDNLRVLRGGKIPPCSF